MQRSDRNHDPMYLYVMSVSPDIHKIGISRTPEKRLQAIQAGNHERVFIGSLYLLNSLWDALRTERNIHKTLVRQRIHSEWFNIDIRELIPVINRELESQGYGDLCTEVNVGTYFVDNTEDFPA